MLDTRQRRALVLAVVTVLSGIVGIVVIAGPAVADTPSGGTVAPSEVYEGSRVNHSYLFTDDDFNANGRNTFEIDLVGLPSDADLESATATVDGGEENVESVEANVTDANTITLDANLSGTGDVTYNVSYTADYTAVDATDDTTYDIETTNTDDGTGPGATATVRIRNDTRPRTQLVGNAPQIVWFDEELDITDLNLQADGEPTGVSYDAGESGTLTGVTGNAEDEGDTVAFSDASDVAFDNVTEGGFDADKDDSSETDDSASNDVDVLVDEPEISPITLRDETGENVSEGRVERGNARLGLTARYDFQPASPLDVRVLDPAGFNITGSTVERPRATLRSSQRDRMVVDLSDRNQTGNYTVTVRTPSTSEIAATASTTVTLTDSTDDGDGGTANETAVPNFTVTWEGGDSDEFGEEPNPQDPGEENVSLRMYAPHYPVDHTPMGNLTLVTPAGQGNTCKLTGAQAFGIDRNNDGRPDDDSDDGSMSNTYTDVTLVDKFEVNRNYTRPGDGKNVTWLDFWDEGEAAGGFGDNSVDLYREDEVVLSQDGCYTQPEQPGWYRWYGYLNGTTDGDPEDSEGGDWRTENWYGDESNETAAVYSHWYYVCDCTDRQEAERKLGTPPDYGPDRNGSVVAPNFEPGQRLALAYYDEDGDGEGELVYDAGDGTGTANETAVTNFTVTWSEEDPNDDPDNETNPQAPGSEDVTMFATSEYAPVNYTPMGNLTVVTPAGQRNHCQVNQAAAFGIDRNNDGAGTDDGDRTAYTDVTLIDKYERLRSYRRDDGRNVTWLDFWDEGEAAGGFGDNSADLYRDDEIVAKYTDCYTQPEQPGWYRWYGYLNGSADGDPEDTTGGDWRGAFWHGDESDEVAAVYSHWYYVCDCANRTEAEQTLGTPPDYDPDRNGSIVAPNYRQNQRLALAYYDTDGDGDGELVYGGERVRLGNRNETEPAAPENLTAIEKPSRVRLEWEQPTAGGEVGYYDVYRGPECGESMTRIDRVGPTQRSVVDRRVEPGQEYCYGVEAVNDVGTSPRPTVTAVPAPLPDPAVTNVSVTKTRLRTDYTEPIVNPLGPQEIDVTVSNLGDHATENDGHTHYGAYGTEYQVSYGLTVYACPKEASNDAVDDVKDRAFLVERCETVDHFDGEELAANDSTTFTAEWDPAGHAGDYEIRAWLDYDRPEADRENDEGRSETFVIVGGTGAGGAGVEKPDSEPNPPGPEPDPPVYGPENEDPSGPTDAPDASDGVTTPSVEVAPASFGPAASGLFLGTFASVLLSFARR